MSRQSDKPRNGVKLPLALQKELGFHGGRQGTGGRHNGAVRTRKEKRKAERQEKRQNIRGSRPQSRSQQSEQVFAEDELDDEEEEEDEDDHDGEGGLDLTSSRKNVEKTAPKQEAREVKSILKKQRQPSPPTSDTSSDSRSRSSSPGLVLDASSQAFRDRAAQDDAEIAALERRLGGKKNKSKKSGLEDGLDDLLEGLEEEERGVKRKSEGQEWLDRKRRKAAARDQEFDEEEFSDADILGLADEVEDEESGSDQSYDEDDTEEDDEDAQSDVDSEPDDGGDFEGFDSGEEDASRVQPKRVRENPYIAPVPANAPAAKYIPPSLRKLQSSEGPSLERLKRQLQGHLNKLSEANLVSILGEVEKIYQSNPRQDVTSVLIDLLLTLFYNRSALPNTFVILHAAFAAAVYKVIGVDFGAELLSQLIDRFDQHHSDETTGKEALNLTSLLANLFTFHVVSSAIIFGHTRLLLERLSENNTELLLRLVRDCGPQLRQDDPSSLKAIVQLMQKEAARMNSAGEQMSVRTKFMIETITDLKNNKMKAATNNAGLSSEHITQMRKVLGSLNNRSLRASEPLRITRDDIKNSDKKGKWWLVGASWKGNDPTTIEDIDNNSTRPDQGVDDDSLDLLALSRQYGMNTDVRRSIFIALLSAVDYQDAHMRLLKLRLKRTQEQEIPKVLLRCAAGEKPYNPYYTQVAKRLCLDKRMRKAFQFALWGFFRRMGERPDAGDEDEEEDTQEEGENVEMSEIANLARLFAQLILDGAETLGVLKVLDLAYIKERTSMFVELLLIMIMTDANEKQSPLEQTVRKVFVRAAETPQITKRLQFFIRKNVRKSDLVAKGDREAVKRGCTAALETLKGLDLADASAIEE